MSLLQFLYQYSFIFGGILFFIGAIIVVNQTFTATRNFFSLPTLIGVVAIVIGFIIIVADFSRF